jgi:hypothetical protein
MPILLAGTIKFVHIEQVSAFQVPPWTSFTVIIIMNKLSRRITFEMSLKAIICDDVDGIHVSEVRIQFWADTNTEHAARNYNAFKTSTENGEQRTVLLFNFFILIR